MNATLNLDSRLLTILAPYVGRASEATTADRGPLPDPWVLRGGSLAALNPQPLPPLPAFELGAAVANELIRAAWLADRLGLDTKRLDVDFEQLCPPPREPIKVPPVVHPVPDPEPYSNWNIGFQLGLAVRLAAAVQGSTRLDELLHGWIAKSTAAAIAAAGVDRR